MQVQVESDESSLQGKLRLFSQLSMLYQCQPRKEHIVLTVSPYQGETAEISVNL